MSSDRPVRPLRPSGGDWTAGDGLGYRGIDRADSAGSICLISGRLVGAVWLRVGAVWLDGAGPDGTGVFASGVNAESARLRDDCNSWRKASADRLDGIPDGLPERGDGFDRPESSAAGVKFRDASACGRPAAGLGGRKVVLGGRKVVVGGRVICGEKLEREP
jgi:hypothetical protein